MREALARLWCGARGRRYGITMLTATGARIHVLDPRVDEINPADVGRGLANECRYAGQTSVDLDDDQIFYSVAEHSVIVSTYAEQVAPPSLAIAWAREGLLHDASEAYLGDMIRPLKYLPQMRPFRRWEDRLQRVIYRRFDVHPTAVSKAAIKAIDDAILVDETCVRTGVDALDYARRFGGPLGASVQSLPPPEAEQLWARRFAELWPEEVEAAARLVG